MANDHRPPPDPDADATARLCRRDQVDVVIGIMTLENDLRSTASPIALDLVGSLRQAVEGGWLASWAKQVGAVRHGGAPTPRIVSDNERNTHIRRLASALGCAGMSNDQAGLCVREALDRYERGAWNQDRIAASPPTAEPRLSLFRLVSGEEDGLWETPGWSRLGKIIARER